jgi:hypothetical protein
MTETRLRGASAAPSEAQTQATPSGGTDAPSATDEAIRSAVQTIYRDGIVGLQGAFSREWVERLREDMMTAFWAAIQRPGGAISRGPRRWYIEVHPEDISGFVDLVTHPWVRAISEAALGPDYRFVEIGFDVPFQGARNQPWHRDFEMPRQTRDEHRLTSLAFNLTGVDVTEDMGPFEIALGTQWDDIAGAKDDMFPDRSRWQRYISRAVQKLPQRGDISARSALTIHRGTANRSNEARPVLVVAADAPDGTNANHHDLQVTRDYLDSLPAQVRDHLTCRVTDELEPIIQHHVIEGLLEADYG